MQPIERAKRHTLRLVPKEFAERFHVYPIDEDDHSIVLAAARPLSDVARRLLEAVSSRRVTFEEATQEAIDDAIRTGYGGVARTSGLATQLPRVQPPTAPTILVVDDDSVQRLVMEAVVTRSGYNALDAENGLDAANILDSGRHIDLVITDLHMPVMSGEELLHKIRATPALERTPVIIITGSSGERGTEAELLNAGADDYMQKPVDPMRLSARVRSALRRAGVKPVEMPAEWVAAELAAVERVSQRLAGVQE